MRYPEKFAPEERVFAHIRRGNRIFISTGCGEPQHLVRTLIDYVESHPTAFYDAEVLQVWSLGVAPYTDVKFERNFRHNSFFIGSTTREAVNRGRADYTPVFLSQVPDLIRRGMVPIDVALIQTSLPDKHGCLSLGISVDIVKAAAEAASLVIVQANRAMPRTHGEGFIQIEEADFILPYDEPLLEYDAGQRGEIVQRIGKYVSRLIQDGDTIQIGYGIIPDALFLNLADKKHLGVHTELISDGIIELMKRGVVDNSCKSINRGKTIATFCMGHQETYDYIDDNPLVEFKTIDYTNSPLIIAQHENMTAINTGLEIDLTGQATAESIGRTFYSGIGGQADFMRGAVLAKNGKTILAIPSTADHDRVSRIVPFLGEGAGTSLIRGDIHYVVTEFGIAYLHGKNIRERAMELIGIAHPDFRFWLVAEAKKAGFIFQDQGFIPGKGGEYPEELEACKNTKTGLDIFLRPVKISDEPLLKEFIYSLSDRSLHRRFLSFRKDMPHERLQEFVVIDYTKQMTILAVVRQGKKEILVAMGQYVIIEATHTADVAFMVRDDYQNRGIGTELLRYLTYLAKRQGLLGFTASVISDNEPMLHVFDKSGADIESAIDTGVLELKVTFRG
jgi:acyl-CoA hydrolase/RimJ/RimL family protein N-acetyltransferase